MVAEIILVILEAFWQQPAVQSALLAVELHV
jgi:hypothetical protein